MKCQIRKTGKGYAAARRDNGRWLHETGAPVTAHPVVSLESALLGRHNCDAHFSPYWLDAETTCPRLQKALLETLPVVFGALVLDSDDPETHGTSEPARPEWRAAFWGHVDALEAALGHGVFAYETRGGGRVVVGTPAIGREAFVSALAGFRDLGISVGLASDRLIDLGRCYRLPFVLRDEQRQEYPTRGRVVQLTDETVARLIARGEALAAANPARQRPPPAPPRPEGSDLRPGDWVKQHLSWAEILEPAGWNFMGMSGAQEHWCRPGKQVQAGASPSAATNYAGIDAIHIFTTSTNLEANRSYDKFGLFCALEGVNTNDGARLAIQRFGIERPKAERREPDEADIALKGWVDAGKARGDSVTSSSEAERPVTTTESETRKRPVQIVQGDLRGAVAPTLEALAALPSLYQRAQVLVELGRGEDGAMGVTPVQLGRLRVLCEDRCRYYVLVKAAGKTLEPDGKASSDWTERAVKVDDRIAQAVLASPIEWGAIRPIAGVMRVPVLHTDGSVCLSGYDPSTRLYVDADGFGEPGTSETDAREALELLEDVLVDFPFGGAVDKAVVVAMWLTACVRQTIPTAPAFLVDSPSSGIGKTPLINVAALLSTGLMAPTTKAPALEDELSKLLFSLCRDQVPVIAFDDVKGSFGGDVFDQLITSEYVQNRVLGVSRVERAPAKALVMITGRNVTFRGDGVYRTLRSRLVTEAERPDERRAAWKHPDLMGYVQAHRTELATACLTIIRAYVLAGRPCKMPPHKEFQGWNLVREALIWLGRPDVVDSVELQRDEADVDYSLYVALCRAWHDAVGDAPITLSGLFDLMGSTGTTGFVKPDLASHHRKALEGAVLDLIEMARTDARAPRVLARRLRTNMGRPAGGYLLRRAAQDQHAGAFRWQVLRTGRAPSAPAKKDADVLDLFGVELPLASKAGAKR